VTWWGYWNYKPKFEYKKICYKYKLICYTNKHEEVSTPSAG